MKKLYEKNAIDSINEGVNKVANIVKKTLGGRGKNVIIKDAMGGIHIINDGVTIANQIELEDQAEDIGASLAKKVAQKTNEQAGDGTTTSILLFQKYVNLMNSIADRSRQTREAIEREVEDICAELDKVKKEVSASEIEPVARISCLNDKMAKIISDVIKEIGKDGAIIVEDAQKPSIEYSIEKGIKIDDGYATPYLITEAEGQKAILTDVPVLLSRKKLDDMTALMPMLEDLAKANTRRIAIFAKEISDDVLTFFVVNKVQGKLNPIIVTTSDLNEIETVTGAKIITEENGLEFELDNLGRAGKIVVSRDSSTVIDGKADPSKVKGKINHLKKLLKEAESSADKYELQERIAKLSGGVAVI
jgi:chaperonin GroEL